MATLSESVMLRLGYSYVLPEYPETLSQLAWMDDPLNAENPTVIRVDDILSELTNIDTALVDSRSNSMALQVGELRLQYVTHIKHLNLDGKNLEGELVRLTGIPLIASKYRDFKRPVSYVAP